MRFTRKSSKALSVSNKVYQDQFLYISKIVDVFSAAYMPEKLHLTKREKDFYIVTVFLLNDGKDLLSDYAAEIYNDNGFRKEKGEIKSYIKRVEKKVWLKTTEEGHEIPKDFTGIDFEDDTYDFNIRFILNG